MNVIEGHAIAPLGFFQNVRENSMTAYAYSTDIKDACVFDLFTASGYLQGIYERTRYLPDEQKPKLIVLEEASEEK